MNTKKTSTMSFLGILQLNLSWGVNWSNIDKHARKYHRKWTAYYLSISILSFLAATGAMMWRTDMPKSWIGVILIVLVLSSASLAILDLALAPRRLRNYGKQRNVLMRLLKEVPGLDAKINEVITLSKEGEDIAPTQREISGEAPTFFREHYERSTRQFMVAAIVALAALVFSYAAFYRSAHLISIPDVQTGAQPGSGEDASPHGLVARFFSECVAGIEESLVNATNYSEIQHRQSWVRLASAVESFFFFFFISIFFSFVVSTSGQSIYFSADQFSKALEEYVAEQVKGNEF